MIILPLLLILMQQGKPPESRCIGPLPLGCHWELNAECVSRAEAEYDECMAECAAAGHNPATCNIHCLGGLRQALSECECETVCPEEFAFGNLPADIFMRTVATVSSGSGPWQPSGGAYANSTCIGPLPPNCVWAFEAQCEIDAQNDYLNCFNRCMWFGGTSIICEQYCMWDFYESLDGCECVMDCDK